MHEYRSHTCNDLRSEQSGEVVRLSGWVHRKRDHGGLLFIDLRDHYGVTQCVFDSDFKNIFDIADNVRAESVIRVEGEVIKRDNEAINPDLPTGEVEILVKKVDVLSEAAELPMPVFGDQEYPEDIRLKYRFLDL
ncbi:OB-fold nucleic acid binding domain-containing protein, partial [Emcibacteraceae bacterium]|nr:OB-fold nucleic acid binding domain-containing protein [Emcibacteraceae bacterium]